jgi:prepilin-type N-terminal cleavage/methylation domain-containing protein
MNRRGFTLIELLVVIAIIAILLTLGTLAFNQWVRKSQIEREVKGLYSDLMYIRQQAVVTGMTHRIHFVSAKSIILLRYSSEGDATGRQIEQKSLPFTISKSSPTFDDIDFNSRGMMEDPEQKSICIFSDAGPVPDSIVIQQSRISLGRIINQGSATCDISNITLQ